MEIVVVADESTETLRKLCVSTQNFYTRKLRKLSVFYKESICSSTSSSVDTFILPVENH